MNYLVSKSLVQRMRESHFTLPTSDDGTIEVAGGGFYSQT